MKNNILKMFLIFLFYVNAVNIEAQNKYKKISDFVKEHEEFVLHGFGQGDYRWESEAVPYFESMSHKPIFYSSYIQLSDIKAGIKDDLNQFRKYTYGWFDPDENLRYNFIPIIGVETSSVDLARRIDTLSAEFYKVLGLTDEIAGQYNLPEPNYDLALFQYFLSYPELWDIVIENLEQQGLAASNINLQEIFEDGSQEAVYKIISLRDSVMVLANENLLQRGFMFSDLEIINGNFDNEIIILADTLKNISSPVMLRFLHESIQGITRNTIYSSETFKEAYRRFVDLLKSNGVENFEMIFHPNFSNTFSLEEWYPGDKYVDWVATSVFKPLEDTEGINRESSFALSHSKPFMFVESAPSEKKYRPNNMFYPNLWEEWFIPYFNFLKNNSNTKIFVYLGIDWGATPGNFNDWGNTRIQENSELFAKYIVELSNEIYLHNKNFWELYNSTTGIKNEELPSKFELFQNYPNPFNPSTQIYYSVAKSGNVNLEIFDLLGRKIETLVNQFHSPGNYNVVFNAKNLSSGVYFYQLRAGSFSQVNKMILIK